MKIYEVGGAIRDELMGFESKDVDYAVETGSFSEMTMALRDMGFTFYQEKPEFFTVRAMAPKGSKLGNKHRVVDFVLCRKDGPSEDGRRPQYVEPGTIREDLARRDFTMNAIARDMDTGEIIDPHGGAVDIENGILRFVGNPMTRIEEDGLRVLRAFRFLTTLGIAADSDTHAAICSELAIRMLHSVSIERVRDEIEKMFECSTLGSIYTLSTMPATLQAAIFREDLRLIPTLKKP
jgi:tRNA nucleotidyltransferase/poly(A) polymerase